MLLCSEGAKEGAIRGTVEETVEGAVESIVEGVGLLRAVEETALNASWRSL